MGELSGPGFLFVVTKTNQTNRHKKHFMKNDNVFLKLGQNCLVVCTVLKRVIIKKPSVTDSESCKLLSTNSKK